MESLEWSFVEELPMMVSNIIKTCSPPNYIINTIIHQIADQMRKETKRKLVAEEILGHTGMAPPCQQQQYRERKYKNGDSNEDDDQHKEDPNRTIPNLNPNWKMSGKEFRRMISPNSKNCSKVGNCPVCVMYNIIGRCRFGSKCHNHHDELPESVRDEMDKWIKHARKKLVRRKIQRRKGMMMKRSTMNDGMANVWENPLHSPNSTYRVKIAVTKLVAMKNACQILNYTPLTLDILKKKIVD
jgi:hypothetical protein